MSWKSRLAYLVGLVFASSCGRAQLPPLGSSDTNVLTVTAPRVVREFRFKGNTVFSDLELARICGSYTNRPINSLDLEEVRVQLTLGYVNKGYVSSGAVLEDQNIGEGWVLFRIVEGRLTDIRLQGNRWLRPSFYRARLLAHGGDPLNVNEIRNTLQVWRDVYPLDLVNADIQPGAVPGEAVMNLKVKERFPYHLGVQYANSKPPSTGAEQVDTLVRVDSLTGHADPLSFDYGLARGKDAGMQRPEFLALDDLSAAYSLPVTASDTRVGGSYSRNSAAIVEYPFDQLDIRSRMEVYGVTLSQPLLRNPSREFSLSLTAERRSSRSYLLGTPYSFSPGAVNGRSVESVVRFAGQFVDRSPRHSVAARLVLNAGFDVLGATRHEDEPDGRFVSLLGQVQYVRRVGKTHNEVLLRLAGQYSPDPLLSLEQLAIGGASTVRGYRENTMIRDQGVVATAEFRVPIWMGKEERAILQLAPFADFGAGWDQSDPVPFDNLGSVGVGVLISPCKTVNASLYWGHALRHLDYRTRSLQDDGIHFSLTVWAF